MKNTRRETIKYPEPIKSQL